MRALLSPLLRPAAVPPPAAGEEGAAALEGEDALLGCMLQVASTKLAARFEEAL